VTLGSKPVEVAAQRAGADTRTVRSDRRCRWGRKNAGASM
jgi:hypothetical protein